MPWTMDVEQKFWKSLHGHLSNTEHALKDKYFLKTEEEITF